MREAPVRRTKTSESAPTTTTRGKVVPQRAFSAASTCAHEAARSCTSSAGRPWAQAEVARRRRDCAQSSRRSEGECESSARMPRQAAARSAAGGGPHHASACGGRGGDSGRARRGKEKAREVTVRVAKAVRQVPTHERKARKPLARCGARQSTPTRVPMPCVLPDLALSRRKGKSRGTASELGSAVRSRGTTSAPTLPAALVTPTRTAHKVSAIASVRGRWPTRSAKAPARSAATPIVRR
mmetsp:Transcript_24417/g.60594  ORF Transcript_24417/g.60594 Transcript_24417/m.60594 type:complete len:240 (-) Transcript_24417:307-1026(-)